MITTVLDQGICLQGPAAICSEPTGTDMEEAAPMYPGIVGPFIAAVAHRVVRPS